MAELIGHQNIVKNEIVNQIMSHPLLVKLLFYKDTNADIFKQPDLTFDQIRQVKRENIYEYRKLPLNNETVARPYLSMESGVKKYHKDKNKHYNSGIFIIYLFCEGEVDATVNGSRTIAIEECLRELFDEKSLKIRNMETQKDEYVCQTYIGETTPNGANGTNAVGRIITLEYSGFNPIEKRDFDEINNSRRL